MGFSTLFKPQILRHRPTLKLLIKLRFEHEHRRDLWRSGKLLGRVSVDDETTMPILFEVSLTRTTQNLDVQ
ncbi:hypothetical protein B9Q13_03290 [Candidatus Marsarchaeota G2 archaeon ECH_B_SAG-G16]|uniref:Uncharacterized protein n=1 Tax=Candidatus Marsarchaeota G2 archaeon ECH_B_SAG-G16 TaxID=1978167 RepID=A0A2R6C1W9_9ARCH|nr:MAG: hypothetical protein B9Q13_03290 [Candidatus Marsarchaeota G2 archaeon ECH_B_SAG-G16]